MNIAIPYLLRHSGNENTDEGGEIFTEIFLPASVQRFSGRRKPIGNGTDESKIEKLCGEQSQIALYHSSFNGRKFADLVVIRNGAGRKNGADTMRNTCRPGSRSTVALRPGILSATKFRCSLRKKWKRLHKIN